MASTEPSNAGRTSAPQNIPQTAHSQESGAISSTPVEMSSLPPNDQPRPGPSSEMDPQVQSSQQGAEAAPLPSPSPPPARLTRLQSTAIGPSLDEPLSIAKDSDSGPTLNLTLLLISGARHPFKLDAKYLSRRNVQVQGNDPYNLSVYKLKELILREWREEWEVKPTSPSSIRLISFGKLLDDKAPISESKFNENAPNVIHMTVKPQDMLDEEEAGGKGGKNRRGSSDADDRSPRCRCTVM